MLILSHDDVLTNLAVKQDLLGHLIKVRIDRPYILPSHSHFCDKVHQRECGGHRSHNESLWNIPQRYLTVPQIIDCQERRNWTRSFCSGFWTIHQRIYWYHDTKSIQMGRQLTDKDKLSTSSLLCRSFWISFSRRRGARSRPGKQTTLLRCSWVMG